MYDSLMRIGKYKIIEKIEDGNYSTVYKVQDREHEFVLKIARDNIPEFNHLIQREFQILSQFNHPNIVPTREYSTTSDKRAYFVLEYIRGKPINEVFQRFSAEFIEAVIQVINGLGAFHNKGFIHSDLKPEHIIYNPEEKKVVLIDFGFAGITTRQIKKYGTIGYVAPEVLKGIGMDQRSDLYSLGVIIYEILSGTDLKYPVKPIKGVPEELNNAIIRLLSEEPSLRPTAPELYEIFKNFLPEKKIAIPSYDVYLPPTGFVENPEIMDKLLRLKGEAVVVYGEIGSGKTRLLKELRYKYLFQDYEVFSYTGRGDGYIHEFLCNALNFKDLELSEKEDQLQIYAEITERLLDYGKSVNLIILIDDLDDLNDYELGLIRFIGHSLKDTRIAMVCTSDANPRVKDLNFFELNLRPFSVADVRILIDKTFFEIESKGSDDLSPFIEWLHKHTGGNPLFITETLKMLYNQNLLKYHINKWQVDIPALREIKIPENIKGILSARLRRIDDNALNILKVLCIADFPLETSIIGGVFPELNNISIEILKLLGLVREEYTGGKRLFSPANQFVKILTEKRISDEEVNSITRKIIKAIEDARPAEIFYPLLGRLYSRIGDAERARHYFYLSGEESEKINDRKGAIDYYLNALECTKDKESPEYSAILIKLAGLYLLSGENHKAIDYYEKSIEFKQLKDEALFGIGKAYSNLGDYNRALEYLSNALGLVKEEEKIVEILNRIAYCYICLKNFVEGERIINEAIAISRKIRNPELEAGALYYYAMLELFRGEYKKGISICGELLKFCDKNNLDKQRAYTANLLSSFYLQTGDIENGLKYVEQAIEGFERIKNLNALVSGIVNKGLLAYRMSDSKSARPSFLNALALCTKIKNKVYELTAVIGIASIYEISGKFRDAILYYKKAKNISPDSAYASYGLSIVYYKLAEIDKAKSILEERMKKKEEILYLIGLGLVYSVLGRVALAKECVEKGLKKLEEECAEISIQREIYLKASQFYYETGDFKKSLELANRAKDITIKESREDLIADALIKINKFRLEIIDKLEIEANLKSLKDKDFLYDYAWLKKLKIESIIERGVEPARIKEVAEELETASQIFRSIGAELEFNRVQKLRLNLYPEILRDYSRRIISVQYLDAFSRLAELISSHLGDEDFVIKLLDLVIETTEAERGAIFIRTEKGMEFISGRNIDKKTIKDARELSKSAIGEINRNKIVFVPNALEDPRFNVRKSVLLNQIRSILCIPLVIGDSVIGAIYLDSRIAGSIFNDEDKEFLNPISKILASIVEKSIIFKNLTQENILLKTKIISELGAGYLLSRTEKMKKIYKSVDAIALSDAPVLICGETGTGKGMLARLIHLRSKRKDKKFLSINCGAIPETLLESELFGHKKGAFTGAISDKKGLLEEAEGGTVFLDEISNTTAGFQAKMLEAIEDKVIRRVGETTTKKIDVRFILASNKDLEIEVEEGRFRPDLYFRINVFKIEVPPLRERVIDIPELARFFLDKYCKELGKNIKGFEPGVMEKLKKYHWPGNIRELMNVIERGVTLCTGEWIKMEDMGFRREVKKEIVPLKEIEKEAIIEALNATGWNRTKAAEKLGITRRTLYNFI
ncbi:MAG: sigma 54-interacting transcriptional regulator, partial [candidate division WOR-3 bacterium]|nr:sigma 54-interacting transcriptional regulator [candidate division WOR-3 bacterium]